MKKLHSYLKLSFFVLGFSFFGFSQVPGDTIVINTLDYNSTTRDTIVDFSSLPNVTFEKILMKYNMRCKDGNVSSGGNPNFGCGEWDYSCNTYLHDSTRIDSVVYKHPNTLISGFSGTTYNYNTQPTYDFYQYSQNEVTLNSITSENQYPILSGTASLLEALDGSNQSGKAQYLYTAAELTAAGYAAGNIDGFILQAVTPGSINFMRVNMQETTLTTLDNSSPFTTGFSEVFFSNYDFTVGPNRIQFATPFVWNGTDNIVLEFSFSNTSPTNLVELQGTASAGMAIYANNGYNVNLAGNTHISIPTTSMTGIQDEITISFWAFGDVDLLPDNTTIIHANNTAGDRNFNLHLPWSNSRIYFDCGNTGSGYDRIDKAATVAEIEGKWNHWAATKNAITGVMNLYLNGVLWHTGTGKMNPIEIAEMFIGKTNALSYNYKGRIDEVRIWDAELGATEIADWMNISVDGTHPNYANLVAYYTMDEGNGGVLTDGINNDIANSNNSDIWNFSRGKELSRFFSTAAVRPSITLFEGVYDLTITPTIVLDSIQNTPNVVTTHSVSSNAGTLLDDDILTDSEVSYWEATPEVIYDALTGAVVSTLPVSIEGSITPSDLNYYRRWPAKFEIMSFVTPYGINLNLGPAGKTWTFDMTDYAPIFNGEKRMTMERGGQWQEDMDIQFWFIVGTPPRDVIDINQIWRPESRNYTDIMTDRYFPAKDVVMNPAGQSFKIKTAITGHGQEGEFIARQHFVDINGGANEFMWNVWTECGDNPIYPQGGTWVYDRAGWCPGAPTDVRESDITALVTPGQVANLDYGLMTASGDSRYIVSNQLVTYGAINHSLDAAVVEIREPSNRVEFTRFNSICHSPKVTIQNTGSTMLTSLTITYWVNNAATPLTYEWTGSLEFLAKEEVILPSPQELWNSIQPAANVFKVALSNPNNGTDEYTPNNYYSSNFEIPEVLPANIVIWFKTNNAAFESSYDVRDSDGNVIFSRSNMTNNTQYRDTVMMGQGCYTYNVYDSGDDGISWWANNDGNGINYIREVGGGTVKSFNGDFGDNIKFNFTVDFPLSYEELNKIEKFKIFPNPATDELNITLRGLNDELTIEVFNMVGQSVYKKSVNAENSIYEGSIAIEDLPNGMYTVQISDKDKTAHDSFVKQ